MTRSRVLRLLAPLLWSALAGVLLYGLSHRLGGVPPLGTLLDPHDGLFRTARLAAYPPEVDLALDALEAPVTVLRDDRGVPHIFAESDHDAIVALGYVVAQDRLFQIDFLPRVAAGRLAEAFGPGAVEADRFLRRTGMDWGAHKNAEQMRQQGGTEVEAVEWFGAGVNAYLDGLGERDLPFEFRMLGYRPARYTLLSAARLLQYFAYDLTFRDNAATYSALAARLGDDYDALYPRHSTLYVPIIPEPAGGVAPGAVSAAPIHLTDARPPPAPSTRGGAWAEGFLPGKGSNNWVVHGSRSATGAPLLAGDMHLLLSLPAIWYEAHLATPAMNTYGVMAPGVPVPVEAFNDHVAWAFTNTGADVTDHYRLELDESRTRYRYADGWRPLETVVDTIFVNGGAPVLDTLYYAHWGPVTFDDEGRATALRWVAHEPSRTMRALWEMNHATSLDDLQQALRFWDTPMQNVVQADRAGNVAMRSTGYVPIRKGGHGIGLLDGSTDAGAWIGRIPFEDLPHSENPEQGFLTSTNQQPTDAAYPYYLGHDWRDSYRSLRIDTLLRGQEKHSVEDFRRYQADVHAVQRDLFVPLLDTLAGLSARADTLRRLLAAWDGDTSVDRVEPLILDEFLAILGPMAWDEPAFDGLRMPQDVILYQLLRDEPGSKWLDVQATSEREEAAGLLRRALAATADTLAARYGWGPAHWRWGDHHTLTIRHLTQSAALRPLWREGFEYPGFDATLSPAGSRPTTHSASWRVIVDFSETPPQGYGVFPGGPSGNPFSQFYDAQIEDYVGFRLYPLLKPATPQDVPPDRVTSRLTLRPN